VNNQAALHGQRNAATAFHRAAAIKRQRMAERQAYRDRRMREQDAQHATHMAQKAAGVFAER
jgi:hypothetical protein